ncbi:MAG: dockerin type I repeat-containing protein [Ruminococcus sp.]|nr:dockerin type I repeat-containing protein [Ruminococcus sp.]
MKKILALLLTLVILCSCASISAFALYDEVTDEFLEAVRVEYDNDKIEKNAVLIYYMKELSENKYVTQYAVSGYMYTCDMVNIVVGNYIIESARPEPVIFADGTMYEMVDAYEKGIINDDDLFLMSTFDEIDMISLKVGGALRFYMGGYRNEDFINVRFEVEGSDTTISDLDENFGDDISGAYKRLEEYFDQLHQKLLNEVLKDVEHIDLVHNNGISVVAIKRKDIEKVSAYDFVTRMNYISKVHMKYIDTFNPRFNEYTYAERAGEVDKKGNLSHAIVTANSLMGSDAEIGFRFGDLIIESPAIYTDFTYGYGVYDYNKDRFYDLYDLRNDVDKYHRLEERLASYKNTRPVGDYDRDKKLSITDTTGIQRHIAGLENMPSGEVYVSHKSEVGYVSDVDNDNVVTVLDATLIQKKLVE